MIDKHIQVTYFYVHEQLYLKTDFSMAIILIDIYRILDHNVLIYTQHLC